MMNTNKWNKCADVIHRLSSRVKNEQNQSTIVDNCHAMIPLCIEKSFYQYESDIGQGRCVEVCGNCSDSIELSNSFVKNTNINIWNKPICDSKLNQQLLTHQFAASDIFDNKNEYIDYIVTNALRQVINHVSFDSLHHLSCCLPQDIEEIIDNVINNDIDSDRLIRILVTEILQCYGTNTRQLTDWYAFANSIKPFLPSTKPKDGANEKVNDTRHKIPSKPKKLPKDDKSSTRISSNRIKSILATIPVSPLVKKEQSSESIRSVNETPPTGVISTTNSITPMSIHSKEKFTPVASKYQSKSKPDQTTLVDTSDKIDHHESFPFQEKSTNRSSSNEFEDSHPHFDYKSNKDSNQSSSNDSVLSIYHKYKHKHKHSHHHHYNHHTTITNLNTPLSRSLSSHTSVPIKESVHKYKQTSVDASSLIKDKQSTYITSRQNSNLNSITTKQLKSLNPLNDKQMLLFKSFASTDNAGNHLQQTVNNVQQISHPMNEVEIHEDSLIIDPKLPSLKNLNKSSLSSSDNPIPKDTNSTLLKKKITRIYHYPSMLADFD